MWTSLRKYPNGRRPFLRAREGASAVEFAIVAPLFLLTLLTLVAYGIYLGTAHSVQQIAADAARVAVAGLDESERTALAGRYIASATQGHAFIDPARLTVTLRDGTEPGQFTVGLSYDANELPIWRLYTFPLPAPAIERVSTIRIGGL